MPKFKVLITELYQKSMSVTADSETEAHTRASDAYRNGEFIIGPRDFMGVEFYVKGETQESLEKIERKG